MQDRSRGAGRRAKTSGADRDARGPAAASRAPDLESRRQGLALIGALLGAALAAPAFAQSAGEPAGASPINAALEWIQGTLLGNLATTAAVIAVAAVGFLMLTGRIEWKRGLVVVIGCFVIFGAATIVAGIRSLATGLR